MTRRTVISLAVLVTVVFTAAIILVRVISGGEKTFLGVAGALNTHRFIFEQVGAPVLSLEQNDGPWEVSIGKGGHRHGYYSFTATGPKGKEALKAYWREISGGSVEVYAIYKTKPFRSDELAWGARRPELN